MATECGVLEACLLKDCCCDPKVPQWELCRQFPSPLGSPAQHSILQGSRTCRGVVSTGLPSPLQRSASSFSTCGRLQWVSLRQKWLIFLQYLRQK